MFRKILIAVVASLSLLSPLALVGETQAHEATPAASHHRHRYEVLVRRSCNAPWQCVGSYRSRDDAWHAAHVYQHRGFETLVR